MRRLENRAAIVTGSGRGIGRAIALKLAAEGASVVVSDIDPEPAEQTAAEIQSHGGKAITHVGDVTSISFGEDIVAATVEAFGGIDILVNNAGFTWDGVIQKMSDEQFQAMIDVHVTAPFRILRAAIGPIREAVQREKDEGREVFRKVVNISSIAATGGNAGQVNYSSAKSALAGMTRTLAKEWGRYRVNVNSVAFGFIETRLTQAFEDTGTALEIGARTVPAGVPRAAIEQIPQLCPLGRAGTAEEAAGAVFLLCTPESNYITGQTLICSGGLE